MFQSPCSPKTVALTRLWDRKANGGFPEVKHLKQLVRNVIDPDRDLGHIDRDHKGLEENGAREEVKADTQIGSIGMESGDASSTTVGEPNTNIRFQGDRDGTSENLAGEEGLKGENAPDKNQNEYCADCD